MSSPAAAAAAIQLARFEPVYVVPEGAAHLTEYGKRHFDKRFALYDRFGDIIDDVIHMAYDLGRTWKWYFDKLAAEGVPQMGGMSAYSETHAVDHFDGKTSTTMPAVIALGLGTAAPTVSTTGAWGTTESTNYGGYARFTVTPSSQWNAASGSAPGSMTNSAQIQFAACTSGTATENGLIVVDNATIGSGNALWWASLSSVVISTTQTPPTIAASALTLSIN